MLSGWDKAVEQLSPAHEPNIAAAYKSCRNSRRFIALHSNDSPPQHHDCASFRHAPLSGETL